MQEHSSSTKVDVDLLIVFIHNSLDKDGVDKTKGEHDYKDDLDNLNNTPEPAIVSKLETKEESNSHGLAKSGRW